MKENVTNVDLLLKSEARVADSIVMDSNGYHVEKSNIFNRPVSININSDLEYALSAVSGGLRVTAVYTSDPRHQISKIFSARDRMLPLLIYVPAKFRLCLEEIIAFETSNENSLQEISLLARKVAEESLSPVIIYYHHHLLPSDSTWGEEKIRQYIGLPEDVIESKYPSYELLFGPFRRKVPDYFNVNSKGLLNSSKTEMEKSLEDAGRKVFFERHLIRILDTERKKFNLHFGAKFRYTEALEDKKMPHAIIAHGSAYTKCKNFMEWNPKLTEKFHLFRISLLNPVQDSRMIGQLSKSSTITVLGEGNIDSLLFNKVNVMSAVNLPKAKVLSAILPSHVQDPDLSLIFENAKSKNPAEKIYCDFAFQRDSSNYPKLESEDQRILKNYPELAEMAKGKSAIELNKLLEGRPPELNKYAADADGYRNLSNFIDQITLAYPADEKVFNHTSPYRAMNFVPAGSSLILNREHERSVFPEISGGNCTACNACTVACPYGAIVSKSATLTQIMEQAMAMASSRGEVVSVLKPLIKNISQFGTETLKTGSEKKLSEVIKEAFEKLAGLKSFNEEKKAEINAALEITGAIMDEGRWIITEQLFSDMEGYQSGSGELFTLSVNSQFCTGCGICEESCADEAIAMREISADSELKITDWLKGMKGTGTATVNHMIKQPDSNPFAALLMEKSAPEVLGSTIQSEAEIRQALTYFLSVIDKYQEEKQDLIRKEIADLIGELSENIHGHLSELLPEGNYDHIHELISKSGKGRVGVEEILSSADSNKKIDAKTLDRKMSLLKSLQALSDQLDNNEKMGRSGFGVILSEASELNFLREYPVNPFNCPVYSSSSFVSVKGIQESMMRKAIDNVRLLRRARLEVNDKYQPAVHNSQIVATSWENLSDDEKNLVPVPVFVGTVNEVKESASYMEVLNSEIPVQILLLDKMSAEGVDTLIPLLSNWMMLSKAYVYQGVLGNNRSLYQGFLNGLETEGPAVYAVTLPGAKNEISRQEMGQLLVQSRAVPVVKSNYYPDRGRKISLSENYDLQNVFVTKVMSDSEQEYEYKITSADYFFRLDDYHKYFSPVDAADENLEVVSDILSGTSEVPSCIWYDDAEHISKFRVHPHMVRTAAKCVENWKQLLKLGGYERSVSEEVEARYEKEFAEQLEIERKKLESELKKKYEEEYKAKESEIKLKIRNKLVELSLSKAK